MGSLSLASGRHSQAIGGQGERDVGYLSPTPFSFSTAFLAVAEYLLNYGSQEAVSLLWPRLLPHTVILFPSHLYVPFTPSLQAQG